MYFLVNCQIARVVGPKNGLESFGSAMDFFQVLSTIRNHTFQKPEKGKILTKYNGDFPARAREASPRGAVPQSAPAPPARSKIIQLFAF